MLVRIRPILAIAGLVALAAMYLVGGTSAIGTTLVMRRNELIAQGLEPLRRGLLLTGTLYLAIGAVCLWGAVEMGRRRRGARRIVIAAVILSALSMTWDFLRAVTMGLDITLVVETCLLMTILTVVTLHLIATSSTPHNNASDSR